MLDNDDYYDIEHKSRIIYKKGDYYNEKEF